MEVDEKLMELQDELKLLGVEVTAEKPKDASDFQVMLKRSERDFDEELMQPKNREKCLEYWWFAKHAYGEVGQNECGLGIQGTQGSSQSIRIEHD